MGMQQSGSYRITLAIFVLHAGTMTAQFVGHFTKIQEVSVAASGNKTPVIADIELRTEADTPWGTLTQTLTGKYWRSRDGKSRQDDTFGNTLLLTASTETWVDHAAKSAISDIRPGAMFVNPADWIPGQNPLGKKKIGDRTANGWREDIPTPNGNLRWEIWTDVRLGMPLEFRTNGPGAESIQRLNNIEERDPDPKLFEIPEGYPILNCAPSRRGRQPALRPAQCGPGPRGAQ